MSDTTTNLVPLMSLTGADFTRAVRAWALAEGYDVATRGTVAPEIVAKAAIVNPDVPAPEVKAKRVPKVKVVPEFDVHTIDGDVITVRKSQGKSTLDGVAERAGVDVDDVSHVVYNGEPVELPRRKVTAPTGPWLVEFTDGSSAEYVHSARGRMNIGAVADALGVKPTTISQVSRGDVVYRVAHVVKFD